MSGFVMPLFGCTLHAFGRISAIPTRTVPAVLAPGEPVSALEPSRLYALAHACGLDYGPTFQSAERVETLTLEVHKAVINGRTA